MLPDKIRKTNQNKTNNTLLNVFCILTPHSGCPLATGASTLDKLSCACSYSRNRDWVTLGSQKSVQRPAKHPTCGRTEHSLGMQILPQTVQTLLYAQRKQGDVSRIKVLEIQKFHDIFFRFSYDLFTKQNYRYNVWFLPIQCYRSAT